MDPRIRGGDGFSEESWHPLDALFSGTTRSEHHRRIQTDAPNAPHRCPRPGPRHATRIVDGQIVVDVVRAGEQDAMCCPGELATVTFAMGKDGLAKVRDEATGRLTLDVLDSGEWVLRRWTFWEPAPAEPEVTLSHVDGRFAGTGGCNRYFASAKSGDMPGDLIVGRAGSTQMACPDPLMQVEDRFLKQLAGVNKLGFMAGQLMLGYQLDGAYGLMLFDRRAAAPMKQD